METTRPPVPDPTPSRYQLFVSVATLLAFATGAEIVAIWLPWVHWFLLAVLCVLAVVKFSYVILVFMHLRWDRLLCTLLFLLGLALAGGTAWALVRLFAAEESRPLTSPTAPAVAPLPKR